MTEARKQYALYLRGTKDVVLQLELPPGSYQGEWLDAVSGRRIVVPVIQHTGGVARITPPMLAHDVALRLILLSK